MKQPRTADFEDDHLKYQLVTNSEDYDTLLRKISSRKKIFILGNGGLMDVSSHGAADLSRLVPGKSFRSFNDAGFLSSAANDFGFEDSFLIWLEKTVFEVESPEDTLILGLSCSGNSANVMKALKVSREKGFGTFLISGKKSLKKAKGIDELCFHCEYFHTTEILTMKLFYDIVYKLGHHCPDISGENARKGFDTPAGLQI